MFSAEVGGLFCIYVDGIDLAVSLEFLSTPHRYSAGLLCLAMGASRLGLPDSAGLSAVYED